MAAEDGANKLEQHRQAALDRLELEELEETAYDDLTRLAADICQTPIALIVVADGNRQWFKARIGSVASEAPTEFTFSSQAIRDPGQVLIVEDASLDPRFAANPFVVGEAHIRFFAGAPLVTSSGQVIGSLCLLDQRPRKIERTQIDELRFLAQQVIVTMERRRALNMRPRHLERASRVLFFFQDSRENQPSYERWATSMLP